MAGPAPDLALISQARAHLGVPVIASLNGFRPGSWVQLARQLEQAGAQAIELNLYAIPTDASLEQRRD
jgi:dihydroorotate dehydrogenase (fumarate)